MTIQATLVTDGSSDTVLLPIIRWLFGQLSPTPVELHWGDLRGLPQSPRKLAQRLACAVEMYPCQILLVHRDAENQAADHRYREVGAAVGETNLTGLPHVCVVPVRMQEAWLLLSEAALREAAGRPSGTIPLGLPPVNAWETIADPKSVLRQALVVASGAKGRRAQRFNPSKRAHRLADLVDDWSVLRQLPSFQRLERDARAAFVSLGLPLHL